MQKRFISTINIPQEVFRVVIEDWEIMIKYDKILIQA